MAHDYDSLKSTANMAAERGATLNCDRAYYSARDPVQAYQETGRQYVGKIRRGWCVDCARTPSSGIRHGLQGLVILFSCTEKPTGAVYRRSGSHRGNHGIIEGDVEAEIMQAFQWAQD